MLFRRGLHLLHGGIRLSKADIIGDGVREQIGPLEHEGEIADGAVIAVFPHIPSAKAHAAGLHIPEPHHKIAQRGLAAARGTDDGDSRFLRNGQGYIVQNGLAAVGEIYMVKFNVLPLRRQVFAIDVHRFYVQNGVRLVYADMSPPRPR